jgi:hypothetical protein
MRTQQLLEQTMQTPRQVPRAQSSKNLCNRNRKIAADHNNIATARRQALSMLPQLVEKLAWHWDADSYQDERAEKFGHSTVATQPWMQFWEHQLLRSSLVLPRRSQLPQLLQSQHLSALRFPSGSSDSKIVPNEVNATNSAALSVEESEED